MTENIPYTVEHGMTGQTVMPESGEVIERNGLICARIVVRGFAFVNNNEGRGFPSRLAALDFINLTMKEGATIQG